MPAGTLYNQTGGADRFMDALKQVVASTPPSSPPRAVDVRGADESIEHRFCIHSRIMVAAIQEEDLVPLLKEEHPVDKLSSEALRNEFVDIKRIMGLMVSSGPDKENINPAAMNIYRARLEQLLDRAAEVVLVRTKRLMSREAVELDKVLFAYNEAVQVLKRSGAMAANKGMWRQALNNNNLDFIAAMHEIIQKAKEEEAAELARLAAAEAEAETARAAAAEAARAAAEEEAAKAEGKKESKRRKSRRRKSKYAASTRRKSRRRKSRRRKSRRRKSRRTRSKR